MAEQESAGTEQESAGTKQESAGTEQESAGASEERMNPDGPTVYGVWKPADGLFKSEDVAKYIHFKSKRNDIPGWVKVVGGDQGHVRDTQRKFNIPAGHEFEVLGCIVMFSLV